MSVMFGSSSVADTIENYTRVYSVASLLENSTNFLEAKNLKD